jgi:outer membrane protein assembly factor BamB
VGLLVLFALLSGCAGGVARQESWPGLIVVDETVYAASYDAVRAFKAESGKLLWAYTGEDERNAPPFYATPVLAEDYGAYGLLLVAGFKDQTVYALRLGETVAEPPDLLWTFSEAQGQYVGSGTVAEGMFLIGNGDGTVYALDLEDGSLAWSFRTQDRVWATPVVVDGVVYVASLDHHLYALDVTTGDERWRLEFDGAVAMTPVVVNGDLWLGDFSSKLHQIDVESQAVVWTYEARDWLWATPLAVDGVLYFADVGGSVYALDLEAREPVWEEPTQVADVLRARPAYDPEQELLFVAGHEQGVVHVLDVNTGKEMNWGPKLRNPGRLPGNLVTDGQRLYTMPVLVEEQVRVYELEGGRELWAYPPAEVE